MNYHDLPVRTIKLKKTAPSRAHLRFYACRTRSRTGQAFVANPAGKTCPMPAPLIRQRINTRIQLENRCQTDKKRGAPPKRCHREERSDEAIQDLGRNVRGA